MFFLVSIPKLCCSFSVDIYHGEDLVGWGIVVDRTDDVHEINYILDGELKLTINEVQEGKDKHPTYDNSP